MRRNLLRLVSILPLAFAAFPLMATCLVGVPAGFARSSNTQVPLKVVVAPASSVASPPYFAVVNENGDSLHGIEVEFTAAESSGVTFLEMGVEDNAFRPAANPRRVRVPADCSGRIPPLMTSLTTGTTHIEARIVSAPVVSPSTLPPPTSIMVEVVAPESVEMIPWHRFGRRGVFTAVPGALSSPAPTVQVQWQAQGSSGGLAGYEVHFETPPSTGAKFSNGAPERIVRTDAFGMASAPVQFDAFPGGKVDVQVPFIDQGTTTVDTYYDVSAMKVALRPLPASMAYGDDVRLHATIEGFPCAALDRSRSFDPDFESRFVLRDGDLVSTMYAPVLCNPTSPEDYVSFQLKHLRPGIHQMTVEFIGDMHPAVKSAPVTVTVSADWETPSARGASVLKVGATRIGEYDCTLANGRAGVPGDSGFPAAGPPGVDVPMGLVRFDLAPCKWSPGWYIGQPMPYLDQRILVESSAALAPDTRVWAYGPTREDNESKWREVTATVWDHGAVFDLVNNPSPVIALAVRTPEPENYQDLWWVGPQENGWGLSITQHGDRIFGALFVYDNDGAARWLVLPGGQWDAERRVFTANVYRPKGSPYYDYQGSRLVAGAPVGTARLEFTAKDAMTLTYTIDGIAGEKRLTRQIFGPATSTPSAPFGGLLWGGPSRNGWGLAIHQQGRSAFAIWFTYDPAGETTWFVAPSALFDLTDMSFTAKFYRTQGPSWLGTPYDPSRLVVSEAGTFLVSTDWLAGIIDLMIISEDLEVQPF